MKNRYFIKRIFQNNSSHIFSAYLADTTISTSLNHPHKTFEECASMAPDQGSKNKFNNLQNYVFVTMT